MGQTFLKCFHSEKEASLSGQISLSLLAELPPDVLIYGILAHLNYRDLCRLAQTNKHFNELIETEIDHLWEKCIKYEMLDESTSDVFDQQSQQKIVQNKKHQFQELMQRRQNQTNPYTEAYIQSQGPTSVFLFDFTLFHRYITFDPFTDPIKPEQKGYTLIVYYRNGLREHQNPLDRLSLSLVTEKFQEYSGPNEGEWKLFEVWWPQFRIKIQCIKCHTPFNYDTLDHSTSTSAQHIQVYNWYKSYPRKQILHRFEYLEIYCKTCQRYSVWKTINHRAN